MAPQLQAGARERAQGGTNEGGGVRTASLKAGSVSHGSSSPVIWSECADSKFSSDLMSSFVSWRAKYEAASAPLYHQPVCPATPSKRNSGVKEAREAGGIAHLRGPPSQYRSAPPCWRGLHPRPAAGAADAPSLAFLALQEFCFFPDGPASFWTGPPRYQKNTKFQCPPMLGARRT